MKKANVVETYVQGLYLRLDLEEVKALANGEVPERLRLAMQEECTELLPVLLGEAWPTHVKASA